MPVIHVQLWKGSSKEVKARIAEAFTDAVSRIADIPPEHVRILFYEFEKEDWAVGGKLASEMGPEKPS